MKLTHCPIDDSLIRRSRDGEITCGGPLVGGHSEAHMVHAYMVQHGMLPASTPRTGLQVGEPCPKCGTVMDRPTRAGLGYCQPCASKARGKTDSKFGNMSLRISRPPIGYYDETGRMTR